MTTGAWRIVAPTVALAALAVCCAIGVGSSVAARAPDTAAAAVDARLAAPAVDARSVAAGAEVAHNARPVAAAVNARSVAAGAEARSVGLLSSAACGRLKQRVERELKAAQVCKADRECTAIVFEYAFRPCGEGARAGALLEEAATDAKAYVDRCQPVLHPVKCAHRITPVCAHGRCALTPPPGE